jgi:HemY protein
VSGRLDAFEWKTPLAELEAPRMPREIDEPAPAVIEPERPVRSAPPPAVEEAVAAAEPKAEPKSDTLPEAAEPAEPRRKYRDGAFAGTAAPLPRTPTADIVIPVVPAPDDPGPDPEPDQEPVRDVPLSGWRSLFR